MKKYNTLISVVIPVYNVEKYLIECLDSIVQQTYKSLEIIIVDDGSTDGSSNICDLFAQKDERIRVVHKLNAGLSDARNVGIEIATGKYITFVDSDDYIELDMISYLYNLLRKENADMSVCQRKKVNENGDPIFDKLDITENLIKGNRNCMKEFFINPGLDTVAWGKLYLRSMFQDVRYPVGKYHEDVFTTHLLIAQCSNIAIGSEQKYCYRQRLSSISKSSFSIKHLETIEGNLERRDYIIRNYSELIRYANAGIIYSVNQCVVKLSNASCFDKKITKELQKYYRLYEVDFLRGNSSILAKIFSVFAYMNLSVLIKIMTFFKSKVH